MCSIELVLFTREWQYRLPSDKRPDVIIQSAVVPPKRHGQTDQLLVGTDAGKIVASAKDGNSKAGRIPPLWDGQAAARIVEILLRLVPGRKEA
ncbi:MAG TPA: hypothetical protein VE545_00855 [Candidatus Dormibacteraeota bacterium]|nr:hypothetical protein [Candidatus Dormibacteraeota bacterium]